MLSKCKSLTSDYHSQAAAMGVMMNRKHYLSDLRLQEPVLLISYTTDIDELHLSVICLNSCSFLFCHVLMYFPLKQVWVGQTSISCKRTHPLEIDNRL